MKRSRSFLLLAPFLLSWSAAADCFQTRDELADAVEEYLRDPSNQHSAVAAKYGWPMGQWCVGAIQDFSGLFENKVDFNEDVSTWDVSSGQNFAGMFQGAASFNQPLESWTMSQAVVLESMFSGAISFQQDLSSWDVSNVEDMGYMFLAAASFDSDISRWSVKRCRNMSGMFAAATSFNQDVSRWDVSPDAVVDHMFVDAKSFRQNLCSWGEHVFLNDAASTNHLEGKEIFANTACPNPMDPSVSKNGPFCFDCPLPDPPMEHLSANRSSRSEEHRARMMRQLGIRLGIFSFFGVVTVLIALRRYYIRRGIDPQAHSLAEFETLKLDDV